MTTRAAYLESLLRCDRPTREIRQALIPFGWDCDEELVTLTREHVQIVLLRFMAGDMSAENVGEWAEPVEGRDDIGLEAGHEEVLLQALFTLANPEINENLTRDSAERLVSQLTAH